MLLRHHIPFERLYEYAFNHLDADKSAVITAHLATCTRCGAQLKRLRMIRQGLQIDDGKSPPAALYIRAQSIFATQPRFKPARRFVFQPTRFRPLLGRAVLVTAILILLLGGLTFAPQVAAAANDSLPGDSIYVLKGAGESIQVAFAFDAASRLEAHLSFAQKRVTEIEKLVDVGRLAQVTPTVSAFHNEVIEVTNAFQTLVRENPTTASALGPVVMVVLTHSSEVLNTVYALVPPPVQAAITIAIGATEQAQNQVENALLPVVPGQTPTVQSNTPTSQAPTLAGQTNTPAIQTPTPSAQITSPPQVNTPAPPAPTPTAQVSTPVPPTPTPTPTEKPKPVHTNTPPGQIKTPEPTKTPGNSPGKNP